MLKYFIHCQMGISRSAALCIGYLMLLNNCEFEDMYSHVKKNVMLQNLMLDLYVNY